MLTPRESEGCKALLEFLPDEELKSLAQTVTVRQVLLRDREEQIHAVITYTQDASEFLKRKKIKREYLFRYLAQNRLAASPTSEKHQLISAILEFWDTGNERVQAPQPEQAPAERANGQAQNTQVQNVSNQVTTVQKKPTAPEEQTMAVAFTRWFFQIWNAQNPTSQIVSNEAFGAQHFYPDCQLKMMTHTAGVSRDEYSGSELTVRRLLALVTEEQLVFSPNISDEGVKAFSDPHGLKIIQVCGVIHQQGNPVGIFDQQFGLVPEPLTENWKIKFIHLKIGAGSLGRTPTLKDTQERLAIESC